MADEEHAHEIIVVKRHGDHEDGHHGGVWKIAFADFMTAMMAFFLVMWLISANDKTKATIASYFNPVKLVDTTSQPKGLEDAKAVESTEPSKKGAKTTTTEKAPEKQAPKAEAENAAKAGGADEGASKSREKHLAAAVIDDPYAALAEIAGQKGSGEKSSAPPTPSTSLKTQQQAISRKGGEAFRDPFAPPPPMQPELQVPPSEVPETEAKPSPPGGDSDVAPTPPTGQAGLAKEGTDGKEKGAAKEGSTGQAPGNGAGKDDAAAKSGGLSPAQTAQQKAALAQVAASEIKAQIVAAQKATGLDKSGPQIDVRKGADGILISLTDSEEFEMFSTGSAVPGKKVVLLMDKIGQMLKARQGQIVIRGFTDARPYRSGHYDNWRLSLDRAQVVHYMLARGGFDEARIAHVEGYADRNPKMPENPMSAVNRRIEILIKDNAQ